MPTRRLFAPALLSLALALPLLYAKDVKDKEDKAADAAKGNENPWPDKIAGRAVGDWIKDLKDPDPSVKENALRTLPLFGPPAAKAVPRIAELLEKDLDVSTRVNAAIALRLIEVRKDDVPIVVKALLRRLNIRSRQLPLEYQAIVRFHAAATLGRFGKEAHDAIPQLAVAAEDTASWEIRKVALGSLALIGGDQKKGPDARAVSALLKGMSDHSAKVRLEAVMGIGTMGQPTNSGLRRQVITALQLRLNPRVEKDKTIVVWANISLMAIDQLHEKYVGEVKKLLGGGNVPTRTHAARALGLVAGDLKKKAPKQVPGVIAALRSALRDDEPAVAGMACWSFGEMAEDFVPPADVEKTLTDLSKDKKIDEGVRQTALATLEYIKGKEKEKTKPKVEKPDDLKPPVPGKDKKVP